MCQAAQLFGSRIMILLHAQLCSCGTSLECCPAWQVVVLLCARLAPLEQPPLTFVQSLLPHSSLHLGRAQSLPDRFKMTSSPSMLLCISPHHQQNPYSPHDLSVKVYCKPARQAAESRCSVALRAKEELGPRIMRLLAPQARLAMSGVTVRTPSGNQLLAQVPAL